MGGSATSSFPSFAGMAALVKQFGETVADVRAVGVTPEEGAEIARRVIGWPVLSDKATPRQRGDQQMLDADLVARRTGILETLERMPTPRSTSLPISPRIRRKPPHAP